MTVLDRCQRFGPKVPKNAGVSPCRLPVGSLTLRLKTAFHRGPSLRKRMHQRLHRAVPIFKHRRQSLFDRKHRLPAGMPAEFPCVAKDDLLVGGPHQA
jgi:hypothetical protein